MEDNSFIQCWNEILTPKWIRFRHLLSGNGQTYSDAADELFAVRLGQRVLDIGCGFGESCLEIGRRVGPEGEVLGVDCTDEFVAIAERERDQAGMKHVRYLRGDAQVCDLPQDHFDMAYSRFGVMFFQSAVRAMRNAHGALKPGGKLCLIVWRAKVENPAWNMAREVALKYLPPPGDGAMTCGPGPFSMAEQATTRAMLEAAGFTRVDHFRRFDQPIWLGRDVEEAVDYQVLVGPSGEIIREAGELGQQKLPAIREELADLMAQHRRADGQVWAPSSAWAIVARKAG
ncbi:MAG: methyltransferase domain-containing protein [Deltaproteobacteria bacterium]|nr:methyltransferase domain-containing protein [Deltaproteobacteria bacterium]